MLGSAGELRLLLLQIDDLDVEDDDEVRELVRAALPREEEVEDRDLGEHRRLAAAIDRRDALQAADDHVAVVRHAHRRGRRAVLDLRQLDDDVRGEAGERRHEGLDRALEDGDRRAHLEGDVLAVVADGRTDVEDEAVLDDVDQRVGDERRLRHLDVVVLHVAHLVDQGEVGALVVVDRQARRGEDVGERRLLDGAEDEVEVDLVEERESDRRTAAPREEAAERTVEDVLGAATAIGVVAGLEERAGGRRLRRRRGAAGSVVVEAERGVVVGAVGDVVEQRDVARVGAAAAADVDADVGEEALAQRDEAGLDVDDDLGEAAQVSRKRSISRCTSGVVTATS